MSAEQLSSMLETASLCSRLCVALYQGRDAVVELAHQCDDARFRFTKIGYSSAAALCIGERVIIAICGSDDVFDWVQNLSARIDNSDNHSMHMGFRGTAHIVYQELLDDGISKLLDGRRLILCGHSSGGAIASAMSSPVVAPRFTASEVYTFGAPRVFTPNTAAKYAAAMFPTYRFVMPGDPVPRLPLRSFRQLFGGAKYAHSGTELRLYDDGTIETERPPCFVERFAKAFSIVGAYSLFVSKWRLLSVLCAKHHIDRYCNALNEAIAKGAQ